MFSIPPSLRDWVPEGTWWTVLDAVAELELLAISADYRDDGRGRPPGAVDDGRPAVNVRPQRSHVRLVQRVSGSSGTVTMVPQSTDVAALGVA